MNGRVAAGNGCPLEVGRRGFLASLGASAMAMKMGLLDFASELFAATPQPAAPRPVVHVVFLRPNADRFWMGWPGASYDVKARQADYTRILTDAAKSLGVDLKVHQAPLANTAAVNAFLEQVAKTRPQGIIATVMHLNHWRDANHLAAKKGDVPTIIFSPMGTSFTGHLQATRKAAKTFVAATQDIDWLAFGLRMLNTIWQMRQSRICVMAGNKTVDRKLEPLGTTLHYVPQGRWVSEYKKLDTTDEMRAIADYYKKEAKKIVEPNDQDILNAAKGYVLARRIMAAEKCHGISVNCLPLVGSRAIPCPPCIAWSRLRDELTVAACEADWNAAISSRLTHLLFDRPGFMQDPAPNTVNNTLMGAHCTCAIKLAGPDKPHEPFILRSHSESNIGVAPQVLWKIGQRITIMKFQGPGSIILGTGKVLRNIDTPPAGGCRTSVEVEVDDVADTRDCKGFHQLFIYGDLARGFKAYCQLAGIKVVHI